MLRNFYINKKWMVSGSARRVYLVAAWLSLGLFVIRIGLRLAGPMPEAIHPGFKIIVLACVLGAATVQVGMEYFLFGFDKSSLPKKIFWFCVMLLPFLGAALYCFLVYLRSDVFKAAAPNGQEATSPWRL
jgi:hypothetical protein